MATIREEAEYLVGILPKSDIDRLGAILKAGVLPAEYPVDAKLALSGLYECFTFGEREMAGKITPLGTAVVVQSRNKSPPPGEPQ